ncbi:hypothetical protein E3N88_14796 [Mikania micrantha]|uniref:Uncharacterized protein n=1 Tax=Mikania micrantha TaxID=192012 RepID=A0A5N6P516_9ASTR|nr:hypothetical protein E3N88_14796 [Mikania micrantha]
MISSQPLHPWFVGFVNNKKELRVLKSLNGHQASISPNLSFKCSSMAANGDEDNDKVELKLELNWVINRWCDPVPAPEVQYPDRWIKDFGEPC